MSETPTERKRRLRFLTLAELVGILAVVIAGLGYWDNHRERTLSDRERAAEAREKQAEARAGALKLTFLMTGTAEDSGARLRLASVHAEQVIQTQSINLPSEVHGEPLQTTGNPRIEADWVEGGLTRVEHAAGHAARQARLPVGIVTTFIEDGQTKTDRALYQIGYSSHPRLLRSDKVQLEGLSLIRRGVGDDMQGAVDGVWKRDHPPAKPPGAAG